MMEMILYSHEGCCLCDRLEEMLQPHLAALRQHRDVKFLKRDIADDEPARQLYRLRIPVLLVDGNVLLEGRPDAAQVASALASLAPADPAGSR